MASWRRSSACPSRRAINQLTGILRKLGLSNKKELIHIFRAYGYDLLPDEPVSDAAAQKKARALRPEAFVFAALTHDLGKAVSTARGEDGEWHACGHENTGVPLTRAMLGRLGVNREIIAYCENMCRLHMRAHVCHYRQAETGETNLLFDESVCPNDLALLAVCGSLVSMLGDLAASVIKRAFGVKDYGNIFPGHGGVLDRFDSILFIAPVVYAAVMWMEAVL